MDNKCKKLKNITTIGSNGESIVQPVCNVHYKLADNDHKQGGFWGNRIRTEYCIWNTEQRTKNPKKLSNKGFFGFFGESSFNSNHLIKTYAKYNPGDYIVEKKKTHRIKEFHHPDSHDTQVRYYTAEIVLASNNIESNEQEYNQDEIVLPSNKQEYTQDEISQWLGNSQSK